MKCPNCYSNVPANAVNCPRCDWPLHQPAVPSSSAAFDAGPSQPWQGSADQAPVWEPEPVRSPESWKSDDPLATGAEFQKAWGEPAPVVPPPGIPVGGPILPQNLASQPGGTVPLTGGQKTQLMVQGLLPLVFVGVFLFFFLSTLRGGTGLFPAPFLLIFVAIAGFTLYSAIQSFRDFASGVALVQTARLITTRRVRNRNSTTYYGEFDGNGKLRINREQFNNAHQGAIYRITYSPISKRLWSMDLVGGDMMLQP